MNLATKGRYAVTAMMDLAIHDRKGPVTLSEISDKQGVSVSYLEQMFSKLKKAKLVVGVRGPGGGYRLARAPATISVAEIITCVDETSDTTRGAANGNSKNGESCITHDLWMEFSSSLYEFLDGVTLERFVNRPEVRELTRRENEVSNRLNFILPRPAMG